MTENAETEDGAANVLKTLEHLTMEFFSPETGNEKKREIEIMLSHFENQSNSWKYCIFFIKNSNNQYVAMFGLTTLENIINKRWEVMQFTQKNDIKRTLWENLLSTSLKKPAFIRNKLAKLIVDIAKFDWPTSYPTFFNEIIELVEKGDERLIIGLVLLQAFIEGLAGPYSTESRLSFLSQERRRELQQLLFHCIPQLLTLLATTLDKFAAEQSLDNDLTNPPPSPEKDAGNSLLLTSNVGIQNIMVSPKNMNKSEITSNREECIKISLLTLQHLFSCLPQTSNIPPVIVQSIFYWANAGSQNEMNEDICIIAMSVINEILYQRHGSTGSATMSCLSLETYKLLSHLTTTTYSSPLSTYSEIYINKVSEFLQLFIALYFKKLECEPQFDAMGFLLLIFQYTFQVPSCSSFISALDIWIKFIDCLKPQDSHRYFDALLGLTSGLLNKIQFTHNNAQLQNLDCESVNDDGETEWKIYLRNCIEIIAKIAEFSPLNIFKLIQNLWQELAQSHDNGTSSELELIDLASFTQLLGRLAPTLFLDKEDSTPDHCLMQGVTFLERLMKLLHHANNVFISLSKTISKSHIQVYAEVLACLGSWSYYMPRCSTPSCTVPLLLQIGSSLLLNKNGSVHSPVLCHAAAHMILSITVCIKPPNSLYHVSDLYLQVQHSLSHLQPKTASVVRQALCMMILECPMDTLDSSENLDGKRLQACSSLIEAWCSPLLAPLHNGSPGRRLACLPAITHLLNYFADHPTQTKKLLAAAVEKPVHAAMEVFQSISSDTENNDVKVAPIILELFLALIHSLHQQLGTTFIRNSIHLFLDIAKRKEHGSLLQLLRVLQAGVEGGALINTAALEEVLSMCLEHILPLVEGNNADADVEFALFELFASILLNRWQHFYSSCVRQGWSPVAPDGASDGAKTNQLTHFRAIMYAISKTLLTENIEVVRLNLHTLECLNIRYKLYSKIVFRQELLVQILSILLRILVHRTAVAALLQEEVCSAIYNLAAVDFPTYFDSFLPSFLTTFLKAELHEVKELLTISKDTDLPTFNQNMLKFTYNVRCYQLIKEPK